MKIIAYQYEANQHCIGCAMERFAVGHAIHGLDENNIPLKRRDAEGNFITPIFSTDENQPTHCETCRQKI